jgi:hypothetical protein
MEQNPPAVEAPVEPTVRPDPWRDELDALLEDWADSAGHVWLAWSSGPATACSVRREDLAQLVRAVAHGAAKAERHACSICVWMVLQDALEPGADDKGLEGWMREAEQRVKNRLAGRGA